MSARRYNPSLPSPERVPKHGIHHYFRPFNNYYDNLVNKIAFQTFITRKPTYSNKVN